jgi:outer membrane protein assembly factor BamB
MSINPEMPLNLNNIGTAAHRPHESAGEKDLTVDSFSTQGSETPMNIEIGTLSELLLRDHSIDKGFKYYKFDHYSPRRIFPGENYWLIGHWGGIDAVDIESGKKLWNIGGFDGGSDFPPNPHGLRIGYADKDAIVAVDPGTQEIKWRYPLLMKRGDAYEAIHGISSNGILLFSQTPAGKSKKHGKLAAINTENGAEIWAQEYDGKQSFLTGSDTLISSIEEKKPRSLLGMPTGSKKKVVRVCAQDISSGKPLWQKNFNLPSVNIRMVDEAGNFYIAAERKVYIFNRTGEHHTLTLGRHEELKALDCSKDNKTVIARTKDAVHIIDADKGKVTFSINDVSWSAQAYAGENGIVFIRDDYGSNRTIAAYDSTTGKNLWSRNLENTDSFIRSSDRVLYQRRNSNPSEVMEINTRTGETQKIAQFSKDYGIAQHVHQAGKDPEKFVVETDKGLLYFDNTLKTLQQRVEEQKASGDNDNLSIVEDEEFVDIASVKLRKNEGSSPAEHVDSTV